MQKEKSRTLFKIISAVGFIGSIALFIYGCKIGIFTDQDKLEAFVARVGIFGATLFVIVQVVQVVFPILPGAIGCLGGVLIFGPWMGFWYNYIGICIGSIFAFLIAKYYGKPILNFFFSEKTIKKYEHWTSSKGNFGKLFTIAIFLPVAPDDFLCYLAGTTDMTLKRFTIVILLGKPFAIALYSLGLTAAFQYITNMLG